MYVQRINYDALITCDNLIIWNIQMEGILISHSHIQKSNYNHHSNNQKGLAFLLQVPIEETFKRCGYEFEARIKSVT